MTLFQKTGALLGLVPFLGRPFGVQAMSTGQSGGNSKINFARAMATPVQPALAAHFRALAANGYAVGSNDTPMGTFPFLERLAGGGELLPEDGTFMRPMMEALVEHDKSFPVEYAENFQANRDVRSTEDGIALLFSSLDFRVSAMGAFGSPDFQEAFARKVAQRMRDRAREIRLSGRKADGRAEMELLAYSEAVKEAFPPFPFLEQAAVELQNAVQGDRAAPDLGSAGRQARRALEAVEGEVARLREATTGVRSKAVEVDGYIVIVKPSRVQVYRDGARVEIVSSEYKDGATGTKIEIVLTGGHVLRVKSL